MRNEAAIVRCDSAGARAWRQRRDGHLTFPRHPARVGADLVVAHTDRYELQRFTAESRLHGIVRWGETPLEMTPARFEEWFEALDYPSDRKRAIREQNEGVPLPEVVPTHDRLLVDALGNVWLRAF